MPSEVLYRDLTVTSPSGGGYLVGTSNRSFIDMLRNFSAAFRLGVQRLPGLRDNVALPRQTGGSTVTWLPDEGTPATESTATFDQVDGHPRTAAAYSEISRLLLKQSDPSAEAVVMRGLAADVAVAGDQALFQGTGTEQPQGIIGTAGVGAISGTTLGYTGLIQAQKDILDLNAVVDPLSLGYVTTPAWQSLKNAAVHRHGFPPVGGRAARGPNLRGAGHCDETDPGSENDLRRLVTSRCRGVGRAVGRSEPLRRLQSGHLGVRAMYSLDVLVLHPQSFTVVSTIT